MRRYGAFELSDHVGPLYEEEVAGDQLVDIGEDLFGRVYTAAPAPAPDNLVPTGVPDPDEEGRRPAGVRVDGVVRRGFPTPSGRLEFYSSTLAQWGWPQFALPTYIRSHVHPDNLADGQVPLISTFRLPVQIHTRSANAKWLDEIAHTNPLWIHTSHAAGLGLRTGDLVRVETEIGYFVVKAWVTEGIRPGVVACSHHMGRWKLHDEGQRQLMATVALDREGSSWGMKRRRAGGAVRVRRSGTPGASGGPMSACTRTSRFRFTQTRCRVCTAGIRRCVSCQRSRATPTATSLSIPSARGASTRSG